MEHKLTIFTNRLKKLNIKIELMGNFPWVYLRKVNNKQVKEKFMANHGFCIGFLPAMANQEFQFTDLKEIFKIIRKYGY